ncbi:MAG: ribosome silencing factor [Phycisphaerae bacterium]|nr:ribosome silencing factor [Phycisphaerae bacterium]
MARRTAKPDTSASRALAIELARLAHDLKCTDVLLLSVGAQSQVCDFFLIASGTSARQLAGVGEQLAKHGKSQGSPAFRSSADTGSSWIIIDFVSVVVHLFEPNQRAYYDLEGLWGDAERVTWRASAEPATRLGS